VRGELRRNPPASEHNPGGLPEYRLRSAEGLKEISVVTWPADAYTTVRVKAVA